MQGRKDRQQNNNDRVLFLSDPLRIQTEVGGSTRGAKTVKAIPGRRLVFIAAAIVLVVTALWAVVFVPRLDRQSEAIKDGAADSSRVFFKFLLTAAVVLLVCVILGRWDGRIVSGVIAGLLYLAAGLVLYHDFMAFHSAVFFLQDYEGFSSEAVSMLVCVGANLIAAILAIKAGNKYRQFASPRDW